MITLYNKDSFLFKDEIEYFDDCIGSTLKVYTKTKASSNESESPPKLLKKLLDNCLVVKKIEIK